MESLEVLVIYLFWEILEGVIAKTVECKLDCKFVRRKKSFRKQIYYLRSNA